MQLQFKQINIVMRLNRMKNFLGKGKRMNTNLLTQNLGPDLIRSKESHARLQEQAREKLDHAHMIIQRKKQGKRDLEA